MVKNSKLLLILLLVNFNSFLYAQTVMFWPQGDVIEGISGGGFIGTTESSITNVTAGNPAAISGRQGFNIGISYQHDTKIKKAILDKADLYRANYYPQAAGIIFDYRNFTFGLGFDQSYNLTRDYGKITAAIVSDSEQGYIESDPFDARTTETLLKNSFITSYSLEQFLSENHQFSIGVSFNHFRYYYANLADPEVVDNIGVNIQENQLSAGIDYKYTIKNNQSINIGLAYEPELNFFEKEEGNYPQNFYKINIPQIVNAGLSINFQNNFQIRSNVAFLFWETLDENVYDIKNQVKTSFTIEKQFSPSFSLAAGNYFTDRTFLDEKVYEDIDINFFAHYIFFGSTLNYKNYNFDFVIADSHLLSDENRKHTIFKIGLGYHWYHN